MPFATISSDDNFTPFKSTTRRNFSPQAKLAIIQEALSSSVHGTAVRHGLAPSQVFDWRRQYRQAIAATTSEQE